MKLFFTLLAKDFRRIVRNPAPMLILLGIPMVLSTLIGLAFGGMSGDGNDEVAPIRLGLLDEDNSMFSQFLRGASNQERFSERIQLTILETEAEGIHRIQGSELSAMLVIPEGFTEAFVNGESGIKLRLVKNPSEYIYPTLAQEGTEVIVTTLNALVRNFQKDLQELHGLFDNDREFDFFRDVLSVSTLIERAKNRIEAAEVYLSSPLVTYDEIEADKPDSENAGDNGEAAKEADFNLFAYLLIGMAAMFLLMIADNCMRDLYRESRNRTLERFRTISEGMWQFVAAKVAYTVIVLLLAVLIIWGGGSLIFGFGWKNYGATVALVVTYSMFGAGLMGFIAALAGKERRADMLNTMLVIIMAACGGSMWPVEVLPPFIRNFITPNLPVYWFSNEVRILQMSQDSSNWLQASALLAGLAVLAISGAAVLFRVRLERGVKEL